MNNKDGGVAFPSTWWDRDSTGELAARETYHGMTLRDYATIKMMQAWRANDEVMLSHVIVRLAQADADAFIRAREKA